MGANHHKVSGYIVGTLFKLNKSWARINVCPDLDSVEFAQAPAQQHEFLTPAINCALFQPVGNPRNQPTQPVQAGDVDGVEQVKYRT